MKKAYIAWGKLHVECDGFIASLPLTDRGLADNATAVKEGLGACDQWLRQGLPFDERKKLLQVNRVLMAELADLEPAQDMTADELAAELGGVA